MLVSCICVCHNKPDITHEAIQSVVQQSYHNWELVIIDSGVLYDQGYYDKFPWINDGRVKLIRSTETEETRQTKAMAPWCFNEAFRNGWATGDVLVFLSDDDLFYPNAFDTIISYFKYNPHALAMYASQDVGVIYPNGWRAIVGERRAIETAGRCCDGCRIDCVYDYLQFAIKREVMNHVLWPEGKEHESHADGIFYESVGEFTPIYPADIKISQNRRTPASTYVPVK